jgi:hypothetical protein
MRPLMQQELMKDRIADLHRQADRDRTARAASLTPHTRREKRGPGRTPGRTAVLARRVLTSLRALIPSPTR